MDFIGKSDPPGVTLHSLAAIPSPPRSSRFSHSDRSLEVVNDLKLALLSSTSWMRTPFKYGCSRFSASLHFTLISCPEGSFAPGITKLPVGWQDDWNGSASSAEKKYVKKTFFIGIRTRDRQICEKRTYVTRVCSSRKKRQKHRRTSCSGLRRRLRFWCLPKRRRCGPA